jgi:epoxyqueuosine reductase QueG
MKDKIEKEIELIIRDFEKMPEISTRWKKPVIAYASAQDPLFLKLREVAVAEHLQPADINPEGRTVITYFLPFEDWIVKSNQIGQENSYEWARAYVETNKLIQIINDHLITYLGELGFKTMKLPIELNMDHERLVSVWSNRHVGFIAGLGTFGINNMLITESGCCGRLGNVVTNLELEPTPRPHGEYCLCKVDSSCGICVDNCIVDALGDKVFDRFGCNEVLKKNAERFKDLGNASCCGKCLVGLPCSTTNPVSIKI